ncbi:hypothetical protein Cgig2_013892 [Carnegiea gigantea]|uniref:Uncharacterized protein n=1 Tax=Carnegiea gigantea TaxID=171969 RepID=A0A9Q1GKJ9_9CARY|nr:hypothetical protein Cgig2_013892 [Carnegiea gigantea]
MKNYGRIAQHAPAYAMNDEFSRILYQQMEFYSSSPSADTINRVRGEVNEDMADLLACCAPLHHNCRLLWRHHSFELQISISNSRSLFLSLTDSCGAICLFISEKLMNDPVWSYCEGVFGQSISMVPLSSHSGYVGVLVTVKLATKTDVGIIRLD